MYATSAMPSPMSDPPSAGEEYTDHGTNPWRDVAAMPRSTFAADVDTASYAIGRRKLTEGTLPPPASVRIEEWVNYFKYGFPAAAAGSKSDSVFGVVMDAAQSPFDPSKYVLRVGVGTRAKTPGERLPASLVFLVDVSGSMDEPDKLPLVKRSLHVLTANLTDKDEVAIVTYAGESRLVLPMTRLAERAKIDRAIDALAVGGSTAMASGIDLAYDQAIATVRPGAISRVIVCTDGDANVGAHTHDEMLKLIADRAAHGVTLSAIGFGMGNYKDALMEQLADKGDGNNYYIDSPAMAERVFADQLTSTLEVAARDVKLQVEFDPARVARYRLMGYENRAVADKDFRNDVPAGQVGWGHQVTAIYELELASGAASNALGLVRVRHRAPQSADPAAETAPVEETFAMTAPPAPAFAAASPDLQFAFAVAAFADVLRGNPDAKAWSLEQIRAIAAPVATTAERQELLSLIDRARALSQSHATIAGSPGLVAR